MGIDQRDYFQSATGYSGGNMRKPSRLDGCPVVKWLLIINITVFLIEMVMNNTPEALPGRERSHDTWIWNFGFFSVESGIMNGQLWRFFSFQFLHAGFGHLLGNMLGVFFFGPFVERWWGSKKFLFFYLSCGVAGALFYAVLLWMPGLLSTSEAWQGMIGASAGVFGILVAVALIAPNLKVLLYFIIPMSIRTLAIGALCFAVYVAITDGRNAGGEAAHIGGALLGFILMKNPWVLSFLDDGSGRKSGRRVVDAQIVREQSNRNFSNNEEVDRILDKVNEQGVQSLTDAEKETLKRSVSD